MNLSTIQALVGSLTNDPNHDRYTLSDINTELDNVQNDWNLYAGIIKDTVTLTVVDGTRQYALSSLTGTPIAFTRATHKGLPLTKRSVSYLDLYAGGGDWTANTGTPTLYFIEQEDPDSQFVTVYPTPGGNDAGANLVLEYIKAHTSMSSSSDVPFMSGTSSNYILRPFDYGVAYDAAYRLLLRDPNPENMVKAVGQDGRSGYMGIAQKVKDEVVETFKALEKEEPPRLKGGRYWRSGNTYVHL